MSVCTAVVFTPSKDHLLRLVLKFRATGVFQSMRSLGIVFRHFQQYTLKRGAVAGKGEKSSGKEF